MLWNHPVHNRIIQLSVHWLLSGWSWKRQNCGNVEQINEQQNIRDLDLVVPNYQIIAGYPVGLESPDCRYRLSLDSAELGALVRITQYNKLRGVSRFHNIVARQ